MEIEWTLVIIGICLLLEAFFSGSEIGLVSADRMKLRHDAAKGSRGAKLALEMLKRPEWVLSTTLVGTNIAVVTNTTVVTALMLNLFGEEGSWLTIAVVAPLIWIFGEIVPKSVFQQRADVITPRAIFVLRFASYLFFPILVVFAFITGLLSKLYGWQGRNPFTLREEILTMLQLPATGDIESVEKTMIRRIFSFSETTAYEVMVPLIDVVAIEQGATCGRAVNMAKEKAHIRLLVYAERIDREVGVLNTLEILDSAPEQPIKPYIRPVRFVPMSKNINELLMALRKDGDVVAVVVDEFGGAVGLVTMEDIMEEIVEEMEDEYDTQKPPIQWVRKLSKNEYIVSARIEVDTLEKQLGIKLPKGNYATLAGFLLETLGEIPLPGTSIKATGISYTIERSTLQAIQEVRLRW
ncbi:MAG: hemolysin family protein [Desulfobacterales bacterium]|nr:hemolysin family protein [Desulfobacterales bacterium]